MAKSLALIAVLAVACRPTEKCDEGAAARGSWITGRDPSDPNGFSPYAKGFRPAGSCNTKIAEKMFSCTADFVRGFRGDSQIMKRALALGFTTYVCELVRSGERTEFPLAEVLTKRASDD